ncbi:hypothetical protein J3R82DRAFT_9472 [Butyriboletus roseoflavus]|nr:hypothetical protein J3R82DRAFT_9472 [Butyriboletus roseoflavus]
MRAPPSFFGYQIFAALVPRELCLQLRGRDDLATALPACVVGGSLLLSFSLLPLHLVSLDTNPEFSKKNAMALVLFRCFYYIPVEALLFMIRSDSRMAVIEVKHKKVEMLPWNTLVCLVFLF